MVAPKKSVKGGIIIDGRTVDFSIPREFVEIFDGRPRVIIKKLEWYGIHPLPVDMLSPQLRDMSKDYEFIAVPREMLKV